MANEQDLITKYVDMTKDFKTKSDSLMNEITSMFSQNLTAATKNYTDLQNTYLGGYAGITSQALKANGQLLDSMENNFSELKKQLNSMYLDMQTKANQAVDNSTKDFQTQCEDVTKKFPSLPEKAYKEVLKAITDSKGKVNSELDRRYKELIDKIDKNYVATKKELTMPDIKPPKPPPLDVTSTLAGTLAGTANQAITAAMNGLQPALQKLQENIPGPSKKK